MNYPRIYADYNGIQISPRNISRRAVPLDTFGSLKELSNAGIRLQNEMKLVIYDYSDEVEDLESNVVIYWDTRRKVWLAEIIDEEIIYISKRDRQVVTEFLCLKCRSQIQDYIAKHGMNNSTVCPYCGEKIISAIEPPV